MAAGRRDDARPEEGEVRYRHKKRGTIYEVLSHHASLQCSSSPDLEALFEDEEWTVYKNVESWHLYVRPTAEFKDGRYEELPDE